MPANKDLFLKWLLAVVLLLSFFTFSGVIVLSLAKPNPSQTETAFIAKKQATKKHSLATGSESNKLSAKYTACFRYLNN